MAKRIVIKLGTSVLTAGSDRLSKPRMVELMRQIAVLYGEGHSLVLVTSGAVLAGWEQLDFPPRQQTLAEKQMLAAIGQSYLMHLYAQFADIYGVKVAQTLLTRDDFRDRRRYLNARNAFESCLERGVLPIVNENDVVTIDEIKLGDNDTLAARVASLVEADLLIIATDCDGLYTANPREDPTAQLIPEVKAVTPEIYALAGGAGSHRGTGGMLTKIEAAAIATQAGVALRIVAGEASNILVQAADETPPKKGLGTLFLPVTRKPEARKRWILAETIQSSQVLVDDGAARAIVAQGKSLLPAGIQGVSGEFEQGQTVRVFHGREEIARGLSRYNSEELGKIQGLQSSQIEGVLGYSYGQVVIHRNDLVLLGSPPS